MSRTLENLLQVAKAGQASWYRKEWLRRGRELSVDPVGLFRRLRQPVASRLKKVDSLLIYKPDDIGDAVHSLPALAHLRRRYPNARIELLCQKSAAPLYARAGLVDRIHAVSVSKVALRFPVLELPDLPHFDLAVYLRTYPAFLSQFKKIKASVKVVPWEPRLEIKQAVSAPAHVFPEDKRHQSVILMELARFVTGQEDELPIRYPAMHWEESDRVDVPSEPFVVVHPFARFETRQVAWDQWNRWTKWLTELGLKVLVVGGPEDPSWDGGGLATPLQGRLSLAQTGYLMAKANLFFGGESGPAHWAAAMGVPSVVLFGGHSDPVEWAPRGRVYLVHRPVPCGPCHRRYCAGYGLKCLKALELEDFRRPLEPFIRRCIPGNDLVGESVPADTKGRDENPRRPGPPPPPTST